MEQQKNRRREGLLTSPSALHKKPQSKRGAMHRLRSLCCAGHDPMMIAPDIFALLHHLIPNAACAIFLTQPNGMPYAFYHEDSDEGARSLFQNQPQMFLGGAEHNVFKIVGEANQPKCGGLLRPAMAYYASNTYQYLVRPSGHHHALEVRLETDHVPAGALMLFREPGCGFSEADIPILNNAARYIEFALKAEFDRSPELNAVDIDHAMIMISAEGMPMYMTGMAAQLLQMIPLSHNFWQQGQILPVICLDVVRQLQAGHGLPQSQISIPEGLLQVRAEWLHGANQAKAMIALHLKRVIPKSLACWRIVQASDLSPQQADVAYLLVTGITKPVIRARLGISEAVLKDCIKSIYQCFAVHSLLELVDYVNQELMQAA